MMIAPAHPYKLVFDERPQYLYARVTADYADRACAMAYLTEIARRINERSQKLLMLERCIPAMLPDDDLKAATLDFFEMIGDVKAALINPYLSHDKAMSFALEMGRDNGANFRLFNCPIMAEEWLLEPTV